jgi:hypothetical protein
MKTALFKGWRDIVVYSEHLNTGLARYSNDLFPVVTGIRIPDHSKTGQIYPVLLS